MRWWFRDDANGTRCLWETWPHWFQAAVVLVILAFLTPAFATIIWLGKHCAAIGRSWYQC